MSTKAQFETDVIPTTAGDLKITFLGHSSLRLTFGGREIYVDPFSRVADYVGFPAADVILITHEHRVCLFADEPALYNDAGNGGRCRESIPTTPAVSISYRGYQRFRTGNIAQGRKGN
jgi:hypothetical protein